ncbi:MAG: phosphoenolpyruvate--protein phosphotransferase [Opitutales bacterium]|nr:phosphoenolpyruvate--protein phosphotransferase [Opitutales bacterium]
MSGEQTTQNQRPEICLHGIGASPGIVRGKAFVFLARKSDLPCFKIRPERIETEVRRFHAAVAQTRRQIQALGDEMRSRVGALEASIFDAHLLVLDDPAVINKTDEAIRNSRLNAEHCFNSVAGKYIDFFSSLDDSFLKERVTDIRDVTERILRNLTGKTLDQASEYLQDHIVVSENLTPSETIGFEKCQVRAILTDTGNHTSHAAIFARTLGIPAVVGLRNATLKIAQEDDLLIDGSQGIVYINPSEKTIEVYEKIASRQSEIDMRIAADAGKDDVTLDGHRFYLEANISGKENLESLDKAKITAVGLFRSEGIFMRTNSFPDEEAQFKEYSAVTEAIPSNSNCVIRTLDIGGDKHISSSLMPPETNPFMGFRAIRFCLEFKDIFKEQLRAILRTSTRKNVRIMFPMISSLRELLAAKEVLEEAKSDLRSRDVPFDENISVGAMIELPAAVAISDDLAKHVDFFSIGTNDLTQYMLAVDRGNSKISYLYDSFHPAVLRAIAKTINSAHEAKIWCAVCGEMAGTAVFAPFLIGCGADALSMSVLNASLIRYNLRHSKLTDMQALAHEVLQEGDPRRIQERLEHFCKNIMNA